MAIATLSSLNAPSPSTSAASSSKAPGSPALGQADFLNLLMAQMKNQDPSNPQSGTDFTAQLAQFSSLQGINQLNQNFTNLLTLQSLTQGVGLIGKSVTYTNAGGSTANGTVNSVSMVGGQVKLTVNNTNVGLDQVQNIQAAPKATRTTATTTSH
jgi:flagellar basal-body rod modification protein FlgD